MLITVSGPHDSAKLILPATIKYLFDPVTSIHALADLMIKRGHVLLFQETT
jgi:hypothetical protein